jgi:hypothetical protein
LVEGMGVCRMISWPEHVVGDRARTGKRQRDYALARWPWAKRVVQESDSLGVRLEAYEEHPNAGPRAARQAASAARRVCAASILMLHQRVSRPQRCTAILLAWPGG